MKISRAGSQKSSTVSAEYFTGRVRMEPVFAAEAQLQDALPAFRKAFDAEMAAPPPASILVIPASTVALTAGMKSSVNTLAPKTD